METWHCKGCDTSVGEDELICPVCDASRYPNYPFGRARKPVRKGPSAETLADLAKFAKSGTFTPDPPK